MRAVITGGAGFIGSALARDLVARGWPTLVIDALTYAGHLTSLATVQHSPAFTFVRADIRDRDALDAAFAAHDPDVVFHLAAESHVDRAIDGPAAFVETNIVGTFQLLQAARAHLDRRSGAARDRFRFIHVSTDEVFGSAPEGAFFSETTPYDPRSPYSASKAGADHLVRAWAHTYGMPVIVSNCSNNYGPHQSPEKLIPLTIANGLEGLPLPVYGDGLNERDWLHVDDHVAALRLMAERGAPGATYLVGGAGARANRDVVGAIADLLDALAPRQAPHRDLIQFVIDRPGHDRRYAIDSSRIRAELGWSPQVGFDAGLARTVRWYADNRAWWAPIRAAGVGERRIGLADAAE